MIEKSPAFNDVNLFKVQNSSLFMDNNLPCVASGIFNNWWMRWSNFSYALNVSINKQAKFSEF